MDDVLVHERALCESVDVGRGTRIAAFVHVARSVRIGAMCELGEGATVDGGTVIGERTRISSGAQIGSGVTLEDDVFVGSNATFVGDREPAKGVAEASAGMTIVRSGASIGAGATILPGLEIGREARIEAGALVGRPVPPYAVVAGSPAQIQGYLDSETAPVRPSAPADRPGVVPIGVRGVRVHRFEEFSDFRGSLTVADVPSDYVPFVPKRLFVVYNVPSRELRGEHAHRACHQFLMCVSGNVAVSVDDGQHRAEVLLDAPTIGIYVPPLVWASQFRHEHDSVLLVLASHPYDPADYIRDYEQFLSEIQASPQAADGFASP
jgi:UDP-2-acetamido-3-amino-2,3-dideoxy-glucuronate N-acetyltransferase